MTEPDPHTGASANSGLRGLARRLKTPIGRGGMLIASGTAVSSGAAALISLVLAGSLGSSGYGTYALAIATVTVLATISGLGLGPIIVQRIARLADERGTERAQRVVFDPLVTVLVVALPIGVILATPLGGTLFPESAGIEQSDTLSLALLLVAMATNVTLTETFRGLREFGYAAFSGVGLARLVTLALLVAAAALPTVGLDTHTALAITGIASAAAAVFALGVLVRHVRPAVSHLAALRPRPRLAIQGGPIAVGRLLTFTMTRVPIWALGFSVGSADVGIFAFALSVAMLVGLITPVMNGTLAPFLASLYEAGDRAGLEYQARRAAGLGALVVLILSVPVLAVEHAVVANILGTEFHAATTVTLVLLIGILARSASGPSFLILSMTGNQTWAMLASAVSLAIALVVVLPMSTLGGAVGAAAGVVLAEVAQQVLLANFALRRLGIRTWVDLKLR